MSEGVAGEERKRPLRRGRLDSQPPGELLVTIEHARTSGRLYFESGGKEGRLSLVAGILAEEQPPMADGGDPVESFLACKGGTYALFQELPPLPGAAGDETHKTGDLSVHLPADLMNYCETSGLTGTLTLERGDKKAVVTYRSGELDVIRVDGSDEDALHEVFAWADGEFFIAAASPEAGPDDDGASAEAATRESPSSGGRLLQVVEVALDSILRARDKRRSATRSVPPLPPNPKVRPPVSLEARTAVGRGERREPTVKIIYLGDTDDPSPPPKEDRSTRHVRRGSDPDQSSKGERVLIDPVVEAQGIRRSARVPGPAGAMPGGNAPAHPGSDATVSADAPRASRTPASEKGSPASTVVSSLAWAAVLLILFFVALVVLAKLPRL